MWIIALVTLMTVGGFLALSLAKEKTYESSAQIVFPSSSTDDQASSLETQMRILDSPAVSTQVHRRYPDAGAPQVGRQGLSSVVTVTVRGKNPTAVAEEANAYVHAFIAYENKTAADAQFGQLRHLELQIALLQQDIDRLRAHQDELRSNGGSDEAITRLDAHINALSAQQGTLDAQVQSIGASSPDSPAQVLSEASPPGSLVGPQPTRDAMLGLGAGLVLGVLLAFALEYLDESLRRRANLERALPRVPVLSAIPRVRRQRQRGGALTPVLESPRSPAAECFRATWTAIQQPTTEEQFRSLLITSAMRGQGKTTVAANLALVTARAGRPTIVVDANLRSPALHEHFDVSNSRGLSSVLFGQASLDDVLVEVPDVAGLTFLPAGPPAPNPWELLSAARFTRLIEELSDRGLVILDSPALLPTSDTSALANRADATIIVVSARTSRRQEVRRAVRMLERSDTRLLGTVLNEASATDLEFTAGGGRESAPQTPPVVPGPDLDGMPTLEEPVSSSLR
jgi:capsular exopolysaccharide synthesis family protein